MVLEFGGEHEVVGEEEGEDGVLFEEFGWGCEVWQVLVEFSLLGDLVEGEVGGEACGEVFVISASAHAA